ncbi:MAG: DNA polymerase III subunit alpha, partial [Pseudomonadota bacterium]
GMRDALRQLQPTVIEDIVALVALYRPGPMENIPLYCDVKNGRKKRQGIHKLIDPILDETQGIIVYQEQVMEIARKMAGYSLGGADMLRRAMGKKIQEAMDAERPKFLKGAAENDVDEKKAMEVWNLLDKFANYGFNKSHAAAYGLVSYQTAWLKANHPVEFMAAVMNLDINLTDKLAGFVQEARRLGIEVAPPCVNRSQARFTVAEGRILYALGALKGVGVEAMRLVEEGRADGPYRDLFDFARRVPLKLLGKRALEMMARAGALDALDGNRRRVFESLDRLLEYSAAHAEEKASGQVSLFGGGDELPPPRLSASEDWLPGDRLAQEHASAGFYLSGHPLDVYKDVLEAKKIRTHGDFLARCGAHGGGGRLAGTLGEVQVRKSARGNRFAYLKFSDPSGGYEVMAFSDALQAAEASGLLETGANLVLTVETEGEAAGGRIMLRGLQPIAEVTADTATGLRVHLSTQDALPSVEKRLALGRHAASEGRTKSKGQGQVSLVLALDDMGAEVELALPGEYPVGPEIRGMLKDIAGVAAVEAM